MGNLLTLNHNQIAQAIALTGHEETILVQGDMGSGKSALLPLVHDYLKEYKSVLPFTLSILTVLPSSIPLTCS